MKKANLDRNIQALQSIYPQSIEGNLHAFPIRALEGLPIWLKGAAEVFALTRLDAPKDPFLYLALPNPEVAFEQLMRVYRLLNEKLRAPVLIVADNLPAKHRPLLVKFKIAFIYKSESVFIPDLGIKFDQLKKFQKNNRISVENKKETLTPFALKLIAGLLMDQIPPEFNLKGLHENILAKGYEVSATKVSLALKELTENHLLEVRGAAAGPNRYFKKIAGEAVWEKVLAIPFTPFFREAQTNFVPQNRETFCLAGETALAQYSNLAAPAVPTIAMSVREYREAYEGKKAKVPFDDLYTPNNIQIWKEPPHLFSIRGVMNPIELFFAMRSHPDERVQISLDEMLQPYGLTRKES